MFEEFKSHFPEDKIIIPVSAYCGFNTDKLIYEIANIIDITPKFEIHQIEEELVEYNFVEEERMFEITIEDGVYVVSGAPLKRIFDMTDFNNESAMRRFARQLRFFGVDQALRDKGIQDGDTVNVFGYIFEFYD